MVYEVPTVDEFRAAHAELARARPKPVDVASVPQPALRPALPQPAAKDRSVLAQYPLATRWGWVR